jgi:Skp family chaperone for outer membrane proteins
MTIQSKSSILQHWQPLIGIAAFLVAGGRFYSEMQTTKKDVTAIEAKMSSDKKAVDDRQDRQFQMIMEQQKSITELEKKAAFEEGYHKAEKEFKK